jgi:hypothetical protein
MRRVLAVTLVALLAASSVALAQVGAAADVVQALATGGLPIAEVLVYDAATDPEALLGRPGQYIAKASWRDSRIGEAATGVSQTGIAAGGTVEVFASEADRAARERHIAEVTGVSPLLAEYRYSRGLIILRVSRFLAPDEAAEYGAGLELVP